MTDEMGLEISNNLEEIVKAITDTNNVLRELTRQHAGQHNELLAHFKARDSFATVVAAVAEKLKESK